MLRESSNGDMTECTRVDLIKRDLWVPGKDSTAHQRHSYPDLVLQYPRSRYDRWRGGTGTFECT